MEIKNLKFKSNQNDKTFDIFLTINYYLYLLTVHISAKIIHKSFTYSNAVYFFLFLFLNLFASSLKNIAIMNYLSDSEAYRPLRIENISIIYIFIDLLWNTIQLLLLVNKLYYCFGFIFSDILFLFINFCPMLFEVHYFSKNIF